MAPAVSQRGEMPMRGHGRTNIGVANRKHAFSTPTLPRQPRSPYLGPGSRVLNPTLHPSASVASIMSSQYEPVRKSPRDMTRTNNSRDHALGGWHGVKTLANRPKGMAGLPPRKEGAGDGEGEGGKALTGHQEYAIQTMNDFYSRKPLERMRSSFRDADIDNSGKLQLEE